MTNSKNFTHQTSDSKAKEYSKVRIKLSIFNIILTVFLLSIVIFSRLTFLFRDWALDFSDNYFFVIFYYFIFFYFFSLIIDFPLDLYSSFFIEHKYGLSNQSFKAWFWEDSKKRLLAFGLGFILLEMLYGIIRLSPHRWWLWCWAFWIFFSVVLGKLAPVLIVPLFYKYDEIKDESLKDLIMKLVEGTKLRISNVYSLNLSKTTKKANAAFCGIGRTKRVVLGDTLISQFNPHEIEVVVAHEVGHYSLKHIWKHITFSICTSLIAFYLAFLALANSMGVLGFSGTEDVATFPLICLIFFLFNIAIMPFQNAYSRTMEHEADQFALNRTKRREDFVTTMKKLGEINLSDPSPHPFIEFIFYSHPSLKKRIDWARGYPIQ